MPEFWGLSIDLPSTSRREEVSELDRIKFSLKQLKGALDILPEVASIALSLKLSGSRLSDETRPLWVELARLNPMPNMASFTSLNIDMGVEYLEILLLYGFPWHHLKSFWVHWRDRPELAPKIMNTLEKCTSLVTFGTCGWGLPVTAGRLIEPPYVQRATSTTYAPIYRAKAAPCNDQSPLVLRNPPFFGSGLRIKGPTNFAGDILRTCGTMSSFNNPPMPARDGPSCYEEK
ncbi:hypothetical protein H0H93_016495 [Arthromyces matolae]|nr:hypothetical protein H0H93_016495 [Arthromyces matolae]